MKEDQQEPSASTSSKRAFVEMPTAWDAMTEAEQDEVLDRMAEQIQAALG